LKPFPTLSLSLSLSSEQASAIGDLYDIADGTVDGLIHAQARSITTDDIRKTLGGSPLLWSNVFVDGIAKSAAQILPEETQETEIPSIALASIALPWTPELLGVGEGIGVAGVGTAVATGAAIGTGLLGIAALAALPQSMNPTYDVIQWDEAKVQELIRQHRPDLYYGQGGSGAVSIGPMPGTASDDFAGPMETPKAMAMGKADETSNQIQGASAEKDPTDDELEQRSSGLYHALMNLRGGRRKAIGDRIYHLALRSLRKETDRSHRERKILLGIANKARGCRASDLRELEVRMGIVEAAFNANQPLEQFTPNAKRAVREPLRIEEAQRIARAAEEDAAILRKDISLFTTHLGRIRQRNTLTSTQREKLAELEPQIRENMTRSEFEATLRDARETFPGEFLETLPVNVKRKR